MMRVMPKKIQRNEKHSAPLGNSLRQQLSEGGAFLGLVTRGARYWRSRAVKSPTFDWPVIPTAKK